MTRVVVLLRVVADVDLADIRASAAAESEELEPGEELSHWAGQLAGFCENEVNNTPEMDGSATFWAESVTEVQL